MAGKKKDHNELHKGIINELTGAEKARSELHGALVAKFKALTDEGKLVMSGERRTAKYTVAKSRTVKPSKSK